MSLTTNKNYNNQLTGSNAGSWGVVLNQNFSILDLNLGGRANISVAGGSNYTVTANQAQNLMHILTGVLTANIQYIFPALGGVYLVENTTSGNYTLTIMCAGGSVGAIVPQGMRAIVFVNPDDTSVKVDLVGANYSQGATASTGSANVQAVATVVPGPYVQVDGALTTWVAGYSCSGAMTLAIGGATAKSVKKASSSGYVNTATGDVVSGIRYLSIYDKINDIHVLINPTLTFGALATLNIGAGLANDGSGNLSIGANGVTNAMLAQGAANTFKGNNTGSPANIVDMTAAQAAALLPVFAVAANGLAPQSGTPSGKFLRDDATWQTVSVPNASSVSKVWLSYNGNSSTIKSSYGVSSVTKVSAGVYKVNFTSAFDNANYCWVASCVTPNSGWPAVAYVLQSSDIATGSIIIRSRITTNAVGDQDTDCITLNIFA